MLAHGVAFCDDERGGVGTWGLYSVRNNSPLCNKEAKCTLRGGKTQSVVTCHLQVRWVKEEEGGVERVHWQKWLVAGRVWKDGAQVLAADHGLRW